MSALTWEQKLAALNALGQASLNMRAPGNWYVSHPRVETKEIADSGILAGRYGNGATPQAAVEDHWRRLTEEEPLAYLVVNAWDKRRHVRWNGFMWQDVPA